MSERLNPETGEATPVRPFADILRDLKQGQVVDEAAVYLQDLVQAVREYGKKGSLTLKIEVAPMKGDPHALMVSAKAENKPPAGEPVAAVFFADDHNNLMRDDPRQIKLPLREAETPDRSNLKDAQ